MRKQYSASFKAQIVLEFLKEEKSMTEIASEYGIHPTQLKRWKEEAIINLPKLFSDRKASEADKAAQEKKINQLYSEIGRLTTQLNWLKKKSGIDPDQG